MEKNNENEHIVLRAHLNAELDGIPFNKVNAYVRGFVKGAMEAIKTTQNEPKHGFFHNGHEYVEIGGIKWATMNIGANKVTDYGLYFQWGDTKGYTAEDVRKGLSVVNWENYKFYRPNCERITKYNKHDGFTKLFFINDAVTAAWGRNWRMPTKNEFKALYDATTHEFVRNYKCSGVAGLVFRDKADPSKELFFPAAGTCNRWSVSGVGSDGYYWSSSLHGDIVYGYFLCFDSSTVYWQSYYLSRCFGFPVRGVLSE